MPKQKKADFDWEAVINGNRIGIGQVFDSITKGEVDEVELEKLYNFVQFSLALMQLCGPQKWAQAKMNAEMMSYLKEKK
jgi:formate/nitrite transporter FocA (FNT family)